MKINNINVVAPISSINSMELKKEDIKSSNKQKLKKFGKNFNEELEQQKKKWYNNAN